MRWGATEQNSCLPLRPVKEDAEGLNEAPAPSRIAQSSSMILRETRDITTYILLIFKLIVAYFISYDWIVYYLS